MSEQNPNNSNLLSKLFGLFNWKIECGCCASRNSSDPAMDSKVQPPGRSTATSEKHGAAVDTVAKDDYSSQINQNYIDSLLQGLKESYNDNPVTSDSIQIQKKKARRPQTPRWNSLLERMLIQAVNLYGANVDLLHAFFPGFKRELIERKSRKAAKLLQKKCKWTPEEDLKLDNLIKGEVADMATITFQFPEKSLDAILERAQFLKSNGGVPPQPVSHSAAQSSQLESELTEDEYDFNRLLTNNSSEVYSGSAENANPADQETGDDLFFDPQQVGLNFNFEDMETPNHPIFDITPRIGGNHTATSIQTYGGGFMGLSNSLRNPFDPNPENSSRDMFLEAYEQPISRMFPAATKRSSFAEMMEERSLKGDRSATENFLDLNKDLRRAQDDSGPNSPSAMLNIRTIRPSADPLEEEQF